MKASREVMSVSNFVCLCHRDVCSLCVNFVCKNMYSVVFMKKADN